MAGSIFTLGKIRGPQACSSALQLLNRFAFLSVVVSALAFAVWANPVLPSGYQVLRQFGKPCRIASTDLPWKIRNGDGRYPKIFEHALNAWNAEGRRLGLGPFFEVVSQGEDLVVDWSGTKLPPDKAGGVFWDTNLGYRRVTSLAMDGAHRVPDGNRAEILMQELGHVLGMGDSADSKDVMHPVMHTRRAYRLGSAALTRRDQETLAWLYGQTDFTPILKPRQIYVRPGATPSPSPSFTPLPMEP